MATQPNIQTLRQLVRCSPAASKLFQWFAGKARGANFTKVRVAAENTGVDYADLVAVFKLLETLSFGRFVEGRHGHESRMTWDVDIRSISQQA